MSSYRVYCSLPKVALYWVLVVPFVVQIVGAVGLVGYLSYRSGQQVVCQLANHLLAEVTKRISDRLDQDLLTSQQGVAAQELAHPPTRQIRTFLTQLQFSPSGQALILRRSGQVVATSTGALQPSLAPQSRVQLPLSGQPPELVQRIEQHLGSLDRLQTPQPLSAIVDQQTYFILVTPYQEPHGLNWLIVTAVPEADFIGKIHANVRQTILLCILALLSATTTGILTAYWIAKPIQRLSRASQFLAEGNWQPLNEDSQVREFAELTQSFNRAFTVAADMSEWQQSEQALRDSEARFYKIANAVPGEIYILVQHLDGTYEFEYMSQGCQEIQELSPEQVLVNPQLSFEQVHPDDRSRMYAAAAHSAETLEPFTQEWRIITPSGKLKWVQLSSRPERRENGDTVWYGVLQDITKRKQAEAALRESEERFQEIAHTVNQFFFVRSAVTQEYLYVSPAYERIWGRSCESLYQEPQSWLEAVHPEDQEFVQASLYQQQAGQNVKREYRIIRPDGSVRWISAEVTIVRDAVGQPLRVVGLAKDITDHKQAELELQHQQALRDAIFNESTDAIFLVDPKTLLITDCNRQAIHLFEVDCKADLIGIEGRTLQRRPFTEAEIDDIVTEMRLKGFWSLELEFVTHKGNLFWGSLAAKPMRIANQTINLVRVSDITDRKRAEEIMKRQLMAIEAAIEGIAILEQGTYSYLNQAHLELFGYHHPADLLGKSWRCLYPDSEIQRFEQEILPSLQQQRSWQGEVTALRQDGSYFSEGLSLTLTEADILICVCRDVSDRHRLDRIKDEFISIVSHELRTPLTAIRGSLGILATGVLDDEPETAKRMVQVALNNSDRLVRLVNDILDLERLESGTVQLLMSACNVTELLEQAVESVQTIAAQAQITIHLSPLSVQVWAAPDAIVQTLTNLLSNAIKFSPPNSTVWVKATAIVDESILIANSAHRTTPPLVLFSIQDQGRGIPAEKLENIFGRFQQVDVSDSRQKGGTGLGLAICRSIIQQHGGKIWAESTLDVGSIFYFTLPIMND